MAITIKEFYEGIVLKMSVLYPVNEAKAIASHLFEHFLGLKSAERILANAQPVDNSAVKSIDNAVVKLLSSEPLQYVLGKAYFMDLEFTVNASVLIPRPETEELVSLILKIYNTRRNGEIIRVLDIGTGSGCIAVSLKKYLADSIVTAIDVSGAALSQAVENSRRNGVNISFFKLDILKKEEWDLIGDFDLIVSNPPYVTESEKLLMHANVLEYEPHSALFVPDDDPLLFYETITQFAGMKLTVGGMLAFEINESFGLEVERLLLLNEFRNIDLRKDMYNKNRFVFAER